MTPRRVLLGLVVLLSYGGLQLTTWWLAQRDVVASLLVEQSMATAALLAAVVLLRVVCIVLWPLVLAGWVTAIALRRWGVEKLFRMQRRD